MAACNECFAGILAAPGDTVTAARSIQLTRDCADLCQLVAAFVARGSEHGKLRLRECAEVCRACADEVTPLPHDYCRRCTDACRQAEDACRTAY